MAQKIKVTICTGTTCYVMGNAQLLTLKDELDPEMLDFVEIEGSTCLQYCKDSSCGDAPFVMINGRVFAKATLPEIKNEIERIYATVKGDSQ